jgi:SAM-dependent methyltransferase
MIGVRRLMRKPHVDVTTLGFPGLIRRIITIFRREKFSHYYIIAPRLDSARCFEIGCPSPIFTKDGAVPVYADAEVVRGSNFSSQTMWQGNNSSCRTYNYDPSKSAGRYFLLEAANLSEIASGIYDCVLSSHVVEYVANPFKTLREWGRVLKENGILILVVPHRDGSC